MLQSRFQKSSSHLKILGDTTVTCSKFHTGDPDILVATVQHLFATATRDLGFADLCFTQ